MSKAQITVEEYVPGSSLAAVDAKIKEMDDQFKAMMSKFICMVTNDPSAKPPEESALSSPTLKSLCTYMKKCKNIILLCGAGISTSAGVPDFRSPGTGLYDNVQEYLTKYNLSDPTQLFTYEFFKKDPGPYYELCQDVKYPSESIKPTVAHYFMKFLEKKKVLLRVYTQNVDMLERDAGLSDDKFVEVHGSFNSGTCMKCSKTYDRLYLKTAIRNRQVPKCDADGCDGIIKPNIVMFGEPLSQEFYCKSSADVRICDCLIVMGTSLQVNPANAIPSRVPKATPRLLINREKVCTDPKFHANFGGPLFFFDHPNNKHDIHMAGDIDASIRTLVGMLGWKKEFDSMLKVEMK